MSKPAMLLYPLSQIVIPQTSYEPPKDSPSPDPLRFIAEGAVRQRPQPPHERLVQLARILQRLLELPNESLDSHGWLLVSLAWWGAGTLLGLVNRTRRIRL